jgi:hemoglobin-like flavoprotein
MNNVALSQHNGYIFLVRTAMTPRQIARVRQSYALVGRRASEAGKVFYDELFSIAPELMDLFPEDLTRQKQKFMQMISAFVNGLDNISSMSNYIADLGRRHALYDVADEHYTYVGEAFISMLSTILGNDFTSEVKEAWEAAYAMIARLMQEASEGPFSSEGFYSSLIRSVMASQYGVVVARQKPVVSGRSQITHAIERSETGSHSPNLEVFSRK